MRREMLARMVTVSGHRGPGALKPLRPSSRQAHFKRVKPAVGAAGPVAVDAAQSALEGAAEDVVQNLAFGARAARALLATPPPPPPPSLCSSR